MKNVLVGMDKSKSFRVYLTITTETVEEGKEVHNTSPLGTAALGRVLTGTGLMGVMLKSPDDKVTVQFKGDGPAKMILATANGKGEVKGYIANPNVELPLKENGHLDVGKSIGSGELTVIKDMGLKEPYVGTISLVSGEIAEDLTAYYYISEQINTSVALGVKIGKEFNVLVAGGMIIELLPDADERAIDQLEAMIQNMKPLTTLIEEELLKSREKSMEEVLESLANSIFEPLDEEYKVTILDFKNISWNCDCSKDRFESALATIGKKDLKEIIDEDESAEIVCQFCEKEYNFNKEELEAILKNIEG